MVFRIVIRYWLMVTMLVQTGMITGQFAYVDTTYDMHRFHFETSYSSLKLSDDKFIIISYAYDMAYKTTLFCINASGDTLWERQYIDDSLSGYTLGANACFDKDKNIIIGGQYYNNTAQAEESVMAKTDSNGNVKWIKVFSVPSIGSYPGVLAYGTIATNTNEYMLICTASIGNYNDVFLMIRTDTDGNELGRWQYYSPYQDWPLGGGIQTSDSGFLFVGCTTRDDTVHNEYNTLSIYVVKVDENGMMEWDTSYAQIRDALGYLQNNASALGALEVVDGYLIWGYTPYKDNDSLCNIGQGPCAWDKAWVAKINKSNGAIIWQKFYGSDTLDYASFTSITPTPDGNYVLCGNLQWNNSDNNAACVYKIDPNGDSLWSVQFNYLDSTEIGVNPYVINTIGTSGFMVTGFVTLDNNADAFPWVVTIDSNGYLPPSLPDTITTAIQPLTGEKPFMHLYPNPNDGNAVVQYSLADNSIPGTLIISDLLGSTIATYQVESSAGEIQIQQNALTSGVYICTLMQGDKQIGVQKFVKF